jgi:hypothetical protein
VAWADSRSGPVIPHRCLASAGSIHAMWTEGHIRDEDVRSSDGVGGGSARNDFGKRARRAAFHPYPKLPGTNYGSGDVDPGPVRIVYVAGLYLDRPRRLMDITRHQVSLVEEEPPSELLSCDRRRHRDVETFVSHFHLCDAEGEASARGESHQIAAVNLPVQQ